MGIRAGPSNRGKPTLATAWNEQKFIEGSSGGEEQFIMDSPEFNFVIAIQRGI
jgi:hypothetical protein